MVAGRRGQIAEQADLHAALVEVNLERLIRSPGLLRQPAGRGNQGKQAEAEAGGSSKDWKNARWTLLPLFPPAPLGIDERTGSGADHTI